MTLRIPNTSSHVEVRRALERIRRGDSLQDIDLSVLNEAVDAIRAEYPEGGLSLASYLLRASNGYLRLVDGGRISLHLRTILEGLEVVLGDYDGGGLALASYVLLESGDYLLRAEGGKVRLHLQTVLERIEDSSTDYYSLEAAEAIGAGAPVYGLSGLSQVGAARADTPAKAWVRGLATQATAAGFACRYVARGRVAMDDWTGVTGSATLTPSSRYYLDPVGGLTTTPTETAGDSLACLGEAVSEYVLDLSISQPIKL